ncbi:type II toxin-antitoxin system RelE/ParE family toxin [Lichenicoccus sp.]|uniref:type II toxin-antitoxin system RelE/ParE family toxin n=1 Tax=Lichenicoccus sp. TaxID=2781899 RepID=UPI003D0C0086
MTRALTYSGSAEADLDDIFDFIAADNPRRARTYIEEIRQACRHLCHTPLIGTERADLRPGLLIRPLSRRVIVAYELPPDELLVLRAFTAGRDYEAIMGGG